MRTSAKCTMNCPSSRTSAATLAPSRGFQAKLRVSQESDPLEQEADRMAETVVSGGGTGAVDGPSRGAAGFQSGVIGRGIVSRKTGSNIATVPSPNSANSTPIPGAAESRIHGLAGGGSPLSKTERSFFESRMGRSFGDVRIHQAGPAAEAANSIGARAFTHGTDIAFAPGEYRPESIEGRRLLAHELTHVMQQSGSLTAGSDGRGGGLVQREPKPGQNRPSDSRERVPNDQLDPDMLVYIAMCYLGIPVGTVREVGDLLLRSVWDAYLQRHGDIKEARAAFEEVKIAFKTTSTLNKLGLIMEFLGSGKNDYLFGKVSVRIPSKILSKYRARALALLGRFGVKRGALTVAGQILRKVTVAIDLAFVAGCAMYVYLEKKARQMARMVEAAIDGALAVANLFRFMVLSPFLLPLHRIQTERYRLSILNVDLSSLDARPPTQIKGFGIIGALSAAAERDAANLNKKVGQFANARSIIPEFYSGIQSVNEVKAVDVLVRKGKGRLLTIAPPAQQFGMKVRSYSRHLESGKILKYRQDPARLADAEINAILRGGS